MQVSPGGNLDSLASFAGEKESVPQSETLQDLWPLGTAHSEASHSKADPTSPNDPRKHWRTPSSETQSSSRTSSQNEDISLTTLKACDNRHGRRSSGKAGANLDGRAVHNLSEKRYRNRLNQQFSRLLEAIPYHRVVAQVRGVYEDVEGVKKRVSKSDVLILAMEYIEALEMETEKLERNNSELLGSRRSR